MFVHFRHFKCLHVLDIPDIYTVQAYLNILYISVYVYVFDIQVICIFQAFQMFVCLTFQLFVYFRHFKCLYVLDIPDICIFQAFQIVELMEEYKKALALKAAVTLEAEAPENGAQGGATAAAGEGSSTSDDRQRDEIADQN